MKRRYNLSGNGQNTLVFALTGFLAWLFLFHGKKTTSSNQKQLIKQKLTAKGYSDRMGDWWGAISDHETGKWTSRLYRIYHNMFGMTQPSERQTTSIGPVLANDNGNAVKFASFSDDDSSVDDLILYLQARQYPQDFESLDKLITFMQKKGYFTAPYATYLSSVKSRL